ncbi:MAG: replication restart helicase PriA [Flavobacteriaceae bacterium]
MQQLSHNFYIDVILPLPLERNFSYAVTQAEFEFIQPGIRVAVPFGKSKVYTALVLKCHRNTPTAYEVKSIHSILDETAVVHSVQLRHWLWISEYYMCTLGEVLCAALPNALLLQSESVISVHPHAKFDKCNLSDDQYLIIEALEQEPRLRVDAVQAILSKKQIFQVLKPLIEANIITTNQELVHKYKPKLLRSVSLDVKFKGEKGLEELLNQLYRSKKLKEIILAYFSLSKDSELVSVSDLKKMSNASSAQIKSLIDKFIFEEHFIEVDRLKLDGFAIEKSITLSPEQTEALANIKTVFEHKEACLLHGVTSSGKTEIYVKMIEEVLKEGQQALFLVPEIALTSQLVLRLKHYFGDQIDVYHSRFSPNERVEIWNRVLKNSENSRVVIGARSSLFLPFSNLGLLIVDEEHEPSYKQFDPAPRYHARDAAIVLAKLHGAKTILGSATPSIESYFNAKKHNKYGYVSLTKRYNDVVLPDIELVDLKDKYKRKRMKGHFSDRLISEIEQSLSESQQIILFQNRRGYAPILSCNTCGHTPECPNCDVSLTYHQHANQLRCHYCSYGTVVKNECGACNSVDLDTKGFGTEQIQEETLALFPDAKVARMDLDTTRGKYSYDRIIQKFERKEIDILVGTQMLTKGLDFRDVKLVGVLNADHLINFPDFRAHERCYQLLQQVSGRAGRTKTRGKVIIQSYNPDHNILQQVSSNQYVKMFEEQTYQRRIYKYPPYFRLIKITLKHRDYNRVNEGATWLATALSQVFGPYVLGPEFPPVSRIRNLYHKNILVKIPEDQSLQKTKDVIHRVKNSFLSTKLFRPVRVVINVDNY